MCSVWTALAVLPSDVSHEYRQHGQLRGAPASDGVCLRAAWAIWLTRLENWSLRATKSVSLLTCGTVLNEVSSRSSVECSQLHTVVPDLRKV